MAQRTLHKHTYIHGLILLASADQQLSVSTVLVHLLPQPCKIDHNFVDQVVDLAKP